MGALLPAEPTGADLASQAVALGPNPPAADATPLPPAELVGALDNSVAAPRVDQDEENITLEFVGDELPEQTFKLRYPFLWEGNRIDSVTVRQLTTGEVGRIVGEVGRTSKTPELMDIYAVMTGLPLKVLRAMPSVDTDPIIERAFDFLPPLFRPASG